MASFLDVLSQGYSDPRGRFNPFAMAKGFTKEGRAAIDEEKQINSLSRKGKFGALERTQGAVSAVPSMGMDFKPRTPEEVEMLKQVLEAESAKRAIQGQDTGLDAAKFNLENAKSMAPIQRDTARFNRDLAGTNADVAQRSADSQVLAAQNAAKLGGVQLQRETQDTERSLDPRLAAYIEANLAAGTPIPKEEAARLLGINPGTATPAQPSMQDAIRSAINESNSATDKKFKRSVAPTKAEPATPALPPQYGSAWQGQGVQTYSPRASAITTPTAKASPALPANYGRVWSDQGRTITPEVLNQIMEFLQGIGKNVNASSLQ